MLPIVAWCTWRLVIASGLRGAYYPHSLILDDFHYPFASVATSLAIMVAEGFGIDVFLDRGSPSRVWRRASVGAVAMLPISWFAFIGSMHAPPYVFYHEVWLIFLNLLLIILACASATGAMVRMLLVRFRRNARRRMLS